MLGKLGDDDTKIGDNNAKLGNNAKHGDEATLCNDAMLGATVHYAHLRYAHCHDGHERITMVI